MQIKSNSIPPFSATFEDRFWSKVKKTESCWLWTAYVSDKGYGRIGINGEKDGVLLAHVASWILHFGPTPLEKPFVLHNCPGGDNPACVNPAHLWIGTQMDNLRDMTEKGRRVNTPHFGEQNGSHKLCKEQVIEIRTRYSSGEISQKQLSKMYCVCEGTINAIVNMQAWLHI